MTDLRKAAEQAATDLEELIHWHGMRDSNDKLMPAQNQTPEIKSAMESFEALRQALAQPEQEPVGYVTDSGKSAYILLGVDLEDDTPLYVASPKDDWVGLTDEEKQGVLEDATGDGGHVYYDTLFQSYEAKLKEKNGG